MLIRWLKGLRKRRHHDRVVNRYKDFASALGEATSYGYIHEPRVYYRGKLLLTKEAFEKLDELEEQYSLLGYRIIEFHRWVGYGGYEQSIDDVWLVERKENERPRFTKDEEQPEIPAPSQLYKLCMETGKPVFARLNEDGEYEYDIQED